MRYVYILLICLILFYILSRYFEKYYSQENFDPSLVPVSSIITLAKVAQKIVDGNGTLTNPANLNIGTTSAKGNLLVTGNSTTNGNKQIDGTLGVTGATTLSNTLDVTGNTTVGGTLGVTGDTTVGGTLGITGATTLTGTLNANGVTTIGATGTPAATTSLTVNGATTLGATSTPAATTSLTVNGSTVITGNTTFNGENTFNKRATLLGGTWTKGTAYVAYDGTYNTLAISPTAAGAITLGCDNFDFKTSNIGNGTNVRINGNLNVTGNQITQGNIITVKYGGVGDGVRKDISVPKYPCRFTLIAHSGGGYFYQTGIWDSTGAWGAATNGDSILTGPSGANTNCSLTPYNGGGWFLTLEYPT